MSKTPTQPCNRIYPKDGADTARVINGVAICTSCDSPIKEHKHA